MHGKLICFLLIFLFVSCTPSPKDPAFFMLMYKSGRYQEMIDAFRAYKDFHEADHVVCYQVGQAFFELKEYENALGLFEQAMKLNPENPAYHSALGLVLGTLEAFEAGEEACNQAIALDRNFYLAFLNRGMIHIGRERWGLAFDDTSRALENPNIKDKEKGVAFANLSTIYINVDSFDRAKEYAERAIRLNPQLPWAYSNLAFLNIRTNNIAAAMEIIEKGLRVDPGYPYLLFYKGAILAKTGDPGQGCLLMQQALDQSTGIKSSKRVGLEDFRRKYCSE